MIWKRSSAAERSQGVVCAVSPCMSWESRRQQSLEEISVIER